MRFDVSVVFGRMRRKREMKEGFRKCQVKEH